MKRRLTLVLCLMLAVMLLAMPVLAAKSVSISLKASQTTVNSGDTVTVTVSATVDSCGSGSIEVSYDSKVFELVSGECTLSGADLSYFDPGTKDGGFAFSDAKAISGSAFKFVLKVKDSASLGSSNVNVSFTADGIAASKSISIKVACAHKYDNSCDTSCNLCGDTRSITHTWDSGKVTKKATCTATGTKTYTCTVCGKTKTEDVAKKSHSYDNDCDADCNSCGKTRSVTHKYTQKNDATAHWQQCSVCGNKKDSQTHTFAEELSSNASGHGHACTECGTMADQQAHTYENDCDTACDVCAYERTITHSYSEIWSSNENGHWHECSICGDKLEMVPHNPGEAATETTDQICLDCGYVLQVAGNHVHTMAGDWLSDYDGHWFLCTCGEYTESEPHTWNEGVIDEISGTVAYQCTLCGHEKTEAYIPPTTAPTTQPTESEPETLPSEPEETKDPQGPGTDSPLSDFPWWIVLAVLLVISVGFNIYLLICLFASKKTGKFAQE